MTVFEMQQLFQTLLETTSEVYDGAEKPDTDTILRYINRSQTEYITKKYLSYPTFMERSIALGNNILDLGTLIETNSLTFSASVSILNADVATLPVDYWHMIKIVGDIDRSNPFVASAKSVNFKPVNIDNIDRYISTVNNIPIILTPVFTQLTISGDTASKIYVIYDNYTTINPTNIAIYLKKPKVLDLTTNTVCELAPYLHNDIVVYALSLYEQEKYKLSSQKNKLDEDRAKRIIGNLATQTQE